jgi:uncharacterized protein
MDRIFEWDAAKAANNFRKHGILFEEAAQVFDDPLGVSRAERIENGEQRWQTVGIAGSCLLLVVAHTVRFEEVEVETEVVRIISARRADRKERNSYEHG